MNQRITGFHQDEERHWVAELECGHAQHVRHDPPWVEREWVLTTEGRQSRLGLGLNCVRCDEMGLKVATAVLAACKKRLEYGYEDAGISGLCEEGRWEAAIGSLRSVDLGDLVTKALSAGKDDQSKPDFPSDQ